MARPKSGRIFHVGCYINAEQLQVLRASAEQNERSISDEIRLALRRHLRLGVPEPVTVAQGGDK